MIKVTLKNLKTGEMLTSHYTARQLLEDHLGEDGLVENMIENLVCHCSPVGETNVIECGCWDLWEDCELSLEEGANMDLPKIKHYTRKEVYNSGWILTSETDEWKQKMIDTVVQEAKEKEQEGYTFSFRIEEVDGDTVEDKEGNVVSVSRMSAEIEVNRV